MKHYFLLLIASFGILNHSNAQWKKIFPPTSKDLYDVQIIDNKVFAVGNGSALLKSTDTGKSWKNLVLTVPANLRALWFLDSNLGFVIGENARIQKTTDGGKNWTQKYVRTASYGYDIAFQNNRGIAVGTDMLAISTVDYGENWTVDTTFSKSRKLNSVTIMPDGNCWAVGDTGYILNKNINSKKWKVIKYPTTVDLNHVSHIGNNILIITGGMPDTAIVGKFYNILLISTDTGKTWQENAISEMKIINDAYFRNEDTGFLVGSNGLISKCRNGVTGSGLQLTGSSSSLNQITFSNGIGIVVGDGGAILRTTNDGGFLLSTRSVKNNNSSVSLVPNPCIDQFSLQTDGGFSEVRVMDNEGRLIYTDTQYESGKTIKIEYPGLYTVTVNDGNGVYSVKKLVVMR